MGAVSNGTGRRPAIVGAMALPAVAFTGFGGGQGLHASWRPSSSALRAGRQRR